MAEEKTRRLKQVATTLNIGTSTIVDYLSAKGFEVENKPTTKITAEQFGMLAKEFASSMQEKQEADEIHIGKKPQSNQVVESEPAAQEPKKQSEPEEEILIKNASAPKAPEAPAPTPAPAPAKEEEPASKLPGIKILGKIDLDAKGRPVTKQPEPEQKPAPEAPKAEEKPAPAPEAPKPAAPEVPKAEEPEIGRAHV